MRHVLTVAHARVHACFLTHMFGSCLCLALAHALNTWFHTTLMRTITPLLTGHVHDMYSCMHARVQVWLNDENGDKRTPMQATVRYKSDPPVYDFVLLQTEGDWGERETPMLDLQVYHFAPYVLVGASARSQLRDPHSTRHGSVLSTCMDANGHIRGDTPSEVGDSGGGCFLMSTGALFALNVGQLGQQSCLLPINIPIGKIIELTAMGQC